MKYFLTLAVGLLIASNGFAGTSWADDEKPKVEEKKGEEKSDAKVESTTTATVTVMVVDDNGKVIKKTTTDEVEDGAKNVRVEVVDGKKVIEITSADGTKRTINIGAAVADGTGEKKVMTWTFKADGEGNLGRLAEVEAVQAEVAKVLKDLKVDVKVDAEKIADQVKAAIIQVKPLTEIAKTVTGEQLEATGEMLMEIGESAFIFRESDEEGEAKEGGKIRRPFQIRRISAAGDGMAEVMKKLDEISKRLEKIEARIEEMDK